MIVCGETLMIKSLKSGSILSIRLVIPILVIDCRFNPRKKAQGADGFGIASYITPGINHLPIQLFSRLEHLIPKMLVTHLPPKQLHRIQFRTIRR